MRRLYLPFFFLGMLLSSCGEKTAVEPYTADEARRLTREIRRASILPDAYVLGLLSETDRVALVDRPGYGEGLEILKYLIPLLHSEGITHLDLWFIPRDGFVQANALLNASRFFEESAAELMGRADYLHLYGEQLDFLRYLYDFNHTTGEGEDKIVLTDLTGETGGERGLLYGTEAHPGMPSLFIQNPSELAIREGGGEKNLISRMAQLQGEMEGGTFFFVADSSHFLWETTGQEPLLVLAGPMGVNPCTPLEGGINRNNYEAALRDFPEIPLKKPAPVAIFLMERARKKFLRGLD